MKGREDDLGSTERDDFSVGLCDIGAILYHAVQLSGLQEAGFIVTFILVHQFLS